MNKFKRTANNAVKVENEKRDFRKDAIDRIPEHVKNVAFIIRNNAEIRRFTALGIINHLLETGEIHGNKNYVVFRFNKFSVKSDGLAREYFYTAPFFLNALVASFSLFSASAQQTIDEFTNREVSKNLEDIVNPEVINNIIKKVFSKSFENSIDDIDEHEASNEQCSSGEQDSLEEVSAE